MLANIVSLFVMGIVITFAVIAYFVIIVGDREEAKEKKLKKLKKIKHA